MTIMDLAKGYSAYVKDSRKEEIPSNRHNLVSGSILLANDNYPFMGLSKGEPMVICWDEKYVTFGNRTWSVDSICDEIDRGWWTVYQENNAEAVSQ